MALNLPRVWLGRDGVDDGCDEVAGAHAVGFGVEIADHAVDENGRSQLANVVDGNRKAAV